MNDKLMRVLQSPAFASAAMLAVSAGLIFAASNVKINERSVDTLEIVSESIPDTKKSLKQLKTDNSATTTSCTSVPVTTASSSSSTSLTTTSTTSKTTNTTTTSTTTVPPTEPPTEPEPPHSSGPIIPEKYAGESANSAYYQERLFVAGDSIAYGYYVYGYIPYEHNLAQESVSMWNLDYFTFNGMGLVDAVDSAHPSLLLMSLGMNDVNMNYPDAYTSKYIDVICQILDRCPDISIVVAGITPVADGIAYTTNDIINSYNSALEQAVIDFNDPRVFYFDANSVIADGATHALSASYSGGDGIHIASASYSAMLSAMFNYLDTTKVKERMMKLESPQEENVTESETQPIQPETQPEQPSEQPQTEQTE